MNPLNLVKYNFFYNRLFKFFLFIDAESDNNSIDVSTTKRSPGRPRILKPKKNGKYRIKYFLIYIILMCVMILI